MSNPLVLFNGPKKSPFISDPVMQITGVLANYFPSVQYESRLQIANNVGKCTVKLTAGSLPLGANITVDLDTNEIVVRWPAYAVATATITNPQAENGSVGWLLSAGWGISTSNPISGQKSFAFFNFKGSTKLLNATKFPATIGTSITASCQVRQGASSAGAAGAAVLIQFFDEDLKELDTAEGNVVSSGSNNAVGISTVTDVIPDGTAYVSIGANAFRKSQNQTLWVDDFSWNYTLPSIGTNSVNQYNISLLVKDAAGRTAVWSGSILGQFPNSPTVLFYTVSSTPTLSKSVTGSVFPAGTTIPTSFASNGIDSFAGILYGVSSANLRTSTDGGTTWSAPTVVPSSSSSVLSVSPLGYILIPSSTGITRRAITGSVWTNVVLASFTTSFICSSSTRVFAISSTSTTVFSLDAGATWGPIGPRLDSTAASFSPGAGRSCAINSAGSFVLSGQIWGGPYGLSSFIPGIAISAASGTSNTFTYAPVAIFAGKAESICIATISNVEILLIGTGNGRIYRSVNNGVSWTLVYTFSNPILISNITFDGQTFHANTVGQIISSANGVNWTPVTAPVGSYSTLHVIKT